jgi:hypothetical protein
VLGEGQGKNGGKNLAVSGCAGPIPEVTTEGLRPGHPEVGDHAAARGVGPKDR